MSADAGALALRELDERLGITRWLDAQLDDPRDPARVTHAQIELLRTRLYLMCLGHRDQDDADHLRSDPACRLAVSQRRGLAPIQPSGQAGVSDGLSSQPTQSRLIHSLSSDDNLAVLRQGLFESARRAVLAERGRRFQNVTLDIDSMPIEVHGSQAGSAYNGHYRKRCYHPIAAMLGETGHWLDFQLRAGNVHTADGAIDFLLPLIDRVEEGVARVARVRADAGFPGEKLLRSLEQRDIGYVFRIRNNRALDRMADPHLRRPVGRPPSEPRTWFHELSYKATSWSTPRRVVLVVQERADDLYLHHFFLLTNWERSQIGGEELLELYRERGTMEGHLGELSSVLQPALSCTNRQKSHVAGRKVCRKSEPRDAERANAATLLLYAHAYNLAHTARRTLARAGCIHGAGLHLERLRTLLLRVPARIIVSARRVTVVLNERTAQIWAAFWRNVGQLKTEPCFT